MDARIIWANADGAPKVELLGKLPRWFLSFILEIKFLLFEGGTIDCRRIPDVTLIDRLLAATPKRARFVRHFCPIRFLSYLILYPVKKRLDKT